MYLFYLIYKYIHTIHKDYGSNGFECFSLDMQYKKRVSGTACPTVLNTSMLSVMIIKILFLERTKLISWSFNEDYLSTCVIILY